MTKSLTRRQIILCYVLYAQTKITILLTANTYSIPNSLSIDHSFYFIDNDYLSSNLHCAEFPPTWEVQSLDVACHLFDVPKGTVEFDTATKEFSDTMGPLNFSIVSVERVQNPNIHSCYVTLRHSLRRKYGRTVEERRLFHGTRAESVEAITHQGFNRIFAADANGMII